MHCYLLVLIVLSAEICSKAAAAPQQEAHRLAKRSSFDQAQFQKDMQTAHNAYRKQHCAPSLTIDENVRVSAQAWAENIAQANKLQHSNTDYGENLYSFSNTNGVQCGDAKSPTDAWYNEIGSYNFGSPGFSESTGHFSQVVWVGSTALGCGCAVTSSGKAGYVVCQYSDSGNWDGEFAQNVLKKGSC